MSSAYHYPTHHHTSSPRLANVSAAEHEGTAGGGATQHENSTAELQELSLGIVFLIFLIFLGGTFFMTYKNRIPLPYTVVLFLYGIVVGAVALWVYPGVAAALGSIPSELLFCIFLPVLIFEGSYAMNTHALRRVFFQSLLLATVGVILNTAFLAVPVKFMFGFSWYAALLLGSLLSATDPVAVVSLLKGLGVDKCISAMVDGESVMNDGTAIIFYSLLLPAARDNRFSQSLWSLLLKCVQLSVIPVVLGPAFGFVQSFWLRRSPNGLHQACVTVSVTYVSYYIAAHLLGTSGVLTLFFQGAFLSYYNPSLFPGREGNLIYSTWEFVVHLGNTVLFSLVGVIVVADVIPSIRVVDVALILVLYLLVIVSRAAMLEILLPLLNSFSSFKLNQKSLALMVHAGLRGGVSATLALGVIQEDLSEGVVILKMTCGIVLLTLLINASTAEYVMTYLGFRCKERYRLSRMAASMLKLRRIGGITLNQLKRDSKYRNANWLSVERFIEEHLEDPYEGQAAIDADETTMVNRLIMSTFKNFVWRQRDEEVISETVAATLTSAVSKLIDAGELLDVRSFSFFHKDSSHSHHHHHDENGAPVTFSLPADPSQATEVEMPESAGTTPSASAVTTPTSRDINISSSNNNNNDNGSGSSLLIKRAPPAQVSNSTASVETLMIRLLPMWVRLAERLLGKRELFEGPHRRAQENAFTSLLAILKCLSALTSIKYSFTSNEEQAMRVDRWLASQLADTNAGIRFFYSNFPEATNNVASSRAVVSILNHMESSISSLHDDNGVGARVALLLREVCDDIRNHIPHRWMQNASSKESALTLRAVAASVLGRGLRRSEVKAISSMGLVKRLSEGDVLGLPANAFLIVVSGTLRTLHGAWTTIEAHEMAESYGDTVGLEALLLPQSMQQGHVRRWRVLSTEATVLFISFNSIKPFLMERSLRSVRALWRAAAVEVLLPVLGGMVTLTPEQNRNRRESLLEILMNGTALIGPRDIEVFDWHSQMHLLFYLCGSDEAGFFGRHSPPCFVSTFFADGLRWTDPRAVLYVVPVSVSKTGYASSTRTRPPVLTDLIDDDDDDDEVADGGGGGAADADSGVGEAAAYGASNVSSRSSEPRSGTGTPSGPHSMSNDRITDLPVVVSSAPSSAHRRHNSSNSVNSASAFAGIAPVEKSGQASDAINVLSHVLLGMIPEDDLFDFEENVNDLSSSPLRRSTSVSHILQTPTTTVRRPNAFSSECASILQTPSEINTPIPLLNQMIAEYAAVLETLCLAALRYVRQPNETLNVLHARGTAERTVDFLTRFEVQMSLLRRTATAIITGDKKSETLPKALDRVERMEEEIIEGNLGQTPPTQQSPQQQQQGGAEGKEGKASAKTRLEMYRALDPSQRGLQVDTDFIGRVCGWQRQSTLTQSHHLKSIIMGMNEYANRRFGLLARQARLLTEWEPALASVERAEDLTEQFFEYTTSSKT